MKKLYFYLTLSLIFGIAIGFLLSNFLIPMFYKSAVEQKVKKFYELVFPESQAEIISLKEESGLYKIFLKITSATGVSYQEAYVTKDGKLLSASDSTILLEASIQQIEKSKNFVDCLLNKKVKIYGVLNASTSPEGAQATLLQLNLLGKIYSPKLFVSCDGALVQQCLEKGITQVPSVLIDDKVEPGIKTIDWFENKTGCKLA
jgi:hypothetical protein